MELSTQRSPIWGVWGAGFTCVPRKSCLLLEVTHDGAAKETSWNLRTERVCEPFDLYLWYARWKVHGYARRCAPTYLHSQLTYSSIGVRLSCSSSSDSTALLVDERVVVARGVLVLVLVLVQVDLRPSRVRP